MVDRLAKNSLSRARLRQGLGTHTEQLAEMVKLNASLDLTQKSCIREDIDEIKHSVTARLDHLEQSVRELFQIVSLLVKLSLLETNMARSHRNLLGFLQTSPLGSNV